ASLDFCNSACPRACDFGTINVALFASNLYMKNALWFFLALLSLTSLVSAQDPTLLKPPKGVPVAIVVFEDLQCPKCRTDSPLESQAAKAHNIPLIRHDFPLPMHNWSFNAAVMARYFDT